MCNSLTESVALTFDPVNIDEMKFSASGCLMITRKYSIGFEASL
jgi:hypothetical protein